MFGLNYPGQSTGQPLIALPRALQLTVADDVQNYNSNDAVHPLRAIDNLLIKDWFAHGYKDYPPPPGDFMVLESGGVFHGVSPSQRFVLVRALTVGRRRAGL